MGKKSRRRDGARRPVACLPVTAPPPPPPPPPQEPYACPVCLETCDTSETNPYDEEVPNGALMCGNGHAICVGCVAKLVRPGPRCKSPSCSQLEYVCPVCRTQACISNFHALVMLKGSWARAHALFSCGCELRAFDERPR